MEPNDRGRDDDTGRYTEEYPPDDFVAAIEDAGGSAGTQDVADAVGCSYETAYKKLHKLANGGTVDCRKVGNANLWVVDDG